MGKINGENLWGKFMGKIMGKINGTFHQCKLIEKFSHWQQLRKWE